MVPRDVETTAGELDDVYLYTVDDLHGVIEENLRNREQAAQQAEEIIDTHVIHFMDWMHSLNTVSTIKAIRDQAATIQQDVLDSAIKRLNRGEDPELVMKEMARSLSNKLIHSPSSGLRNVGQENRDELLRAARILFDIPSNKSDPDNNH